MGEFRFPYDFTNRNNEAADMKRAVIATILCAVLGISLTAAGATVAYWRFEEGPENAPVAHPVTGGVYYAAVADSSGNGNELSTWNETWGGYSYTSDAAFATVPQTGAANRFSVRNSGSLPSMWTSVTDSIRSISPAAFTIEATFKLENGTDRTIVGRDSYGTASSNPMLAALYLQALANNAVAIRFCDVSGYWHQAVSRVGVIKTFNNSSNPTGYGVPWYSLAAVSDGQTLSLYLANHDTESGYVLVAQTDMTQSGSPNTALTAGAGSGSDWTGGNWSVGRGLYNSGHTYRAWGLIDEVRISNSALDPSAFLAAPNYSGVAAYWRFEDGPENEPVPHPAADGVFAPAVKDSSSSGNALSVWNQGAAGYTYTADLGFTRVDGLANNFCVKNTGADPSMWTSTQAPINGISPAAFTIEAMFKLANGGYRTIVGRDSYGTVNGDAALAALYFQAIPNNAVAIKFCDVSGFWHQAVSADGAIQTFNPDTNPNGDGVPWYAMAGVSNGQMLSLYLRNVTAGGAWQLLAQTDMTQSGSPNRALTAGAGDGGDWDAGNWSVGRGLHNGNHEDRAIGFIDEVRISTIARTTSQLLLCQRPTGTQWMGLCNGNLSLSQLSIPGTHDSGARYEPLSGTAKCQNLTIAEQLNVGVRFLDIRCRHINNTFTIHHGQVYQNINFDDVLNAVIGFLTANPTESVLMSVKEEHTPENNTRSFEATFNAYVQQNPGKWYLKDTIPTLSQARGKIVLLRRFGASGLPKGIPATNWADNTTFNINNGSSQLRVQDYYAVSSTSAKWNAVLPILNEAPGANLQTLYLNFTSGYTSGLFGIPSITTVSNYVNPRIVTYFSSAPKGRYGTIPMDFVDSQKAALIFATNFEVHAAYEIADLNNDLQVDMNDLAILYLQWLTVPSDKRADTYPDNFVNLKDFNYLSEYWKK
jgi:1-phosphatidylinositol phosphodiesterase